jgi:hypothetical protein
MAPAKLAKRRSSTGRRNRAALAEDPRCNEVKTWVITYFSHEFSLPPQSIPENSQLKKWGYADEKALAFLAAQFNKAVLTRPQWHGAHIAPPELVDAVKGKTIGGLIAFLCRKVTSVQPA